MGGKREGGLTALKEAFWQGRLGAGRQDVDSAEKRQERRELLAVERGTEFRGKVLPL